jgi:hypothetical protein
MKSFFSRLGGKDRKKDRKKDWGKDEKMGTPSSDLQGATPQRGLLDRGLSTSSGHVASPEPTRTRLDTALADSRNLNPLALAVNGNSRGAESRDKLGSLSKGARTQELEKRDAARRKKEKKKKKKEKQTAALKMNGSKDVTDRETPGSPGSVTVGKRSSLVSGGHASRARMSTGASTSEGEAPPSAILMPFGESQGKQSQGQPSQSQRPLSEQEYYTMLQQAMSASMADNASRQQHQLLIDPTIPVPIPSASYLPDAPSEAPDLHVARAMAESQFAARQADELQKARDSLFDAAVSKAMEASMSSTDYDHLLRDMKMWMIDLDATSDDVVSGLTMVRKREEEIAGKIGKALEKGDTHRLTRLLWEQENLPEVKRRIEALQEAMVPVAIASSDLLALRQRILDSYPPIVESQKARDQIIEELFNSLKGALRAPPSSSSQADDGDVDDGQDEGASTSKSRARPSRASYKLIETSEDCQDSSDLRCLFVGMLDDAKKISRAPESIVREAKAMVRTAFKEQQSSASIDLSEIVAPDESDRERHREGDRDSESRTEVSSIKSTATELQTLIKDTAVDSGSGSVDSGALKGLNGAFRASSNKKELQRLKKEGQKQSVREKEESDDQHQKRNQKSAATKIKPFNLSKSRIRVETTKNSKKELPPIRRVPAFFSLTHELLTDSGIVSQSVNWQSKEYSIEHFSSKYHTIPAPVNVDEFCSEDVLELLSYVKKHARSFGEQPKSANIPSSSKHGKEEKWYTMVEVAGAVEGLMAACEAFLTWKLPEAETMSDAISMSCHSLKRTVSQTLSIIADTAYAHDTLRVAIKKHRLPWDENIISQVRWDAQHAASVIMQAAIDCAEEQERKRGIRKSTTQKTVLKPLGQAVIATFAVHQLSGGFGGEAALVCDQLVDLCVHYARQLDPKWFRGTKVVKS